MGSIYVTMRTVNRHDLCTALILNGNFVSPLCISAHSALSLNNTKLVNYVLV